MRVCTQCGHRNADADPECAGCGVVFSHVKRARAAEQASGDRNCSWMDTDRPCLYPWTVNIGGHKLCREHSLISQGGKTFGVQGNGLTAQFLGSMYGEAARQGRQKFRHGNRVPVEDGEDWGRVADYLPAGVRR